MIKHAWETQEAQLYNTFLITQFSANLTKTWALRPSENARILANFGASQLV